jgi:2-polyprenyl-3-methyl-5-hydroxy-6-metoxy-1,4-benzoquinol methylase
MNNRALGLALDNLGAAPATAADVGAGIGRVVDLLQSRGISVVGCELDPIRAASAGVDQADVRQWSPPHPVDVVTCTELVEHLPHGDHLPLLERMASWLTPTGALVVSTPQRHSIVAWTERAFHLASRRGRYEWWDPTHISVSTRRYWEHLFASAHLDVTQRIGIHLVSDVVAKVVPPVRRFQYSVHTGPAALLAFDLVYVLRPAPRPPPAASSFSAV